MKSIKDFNIQQKFLLAMLCCVTIPLVLLSVYIIYQTDEVKQSNYNYAQVQIQENMYRSLEYEIANLDNAAYNIYSNFNLLRGIADKKTNANYYLVHNAITDIFNLYTGSTRKNNLLNVNFYNSDNELLSYYLYYRPVTLKGKIPNNYQYYTRVSEETGDHTRMLVFMADSDFQMEVVRYYYPINFKGSYIGFLEFTLDAKSIEEVIESFNQFHKGTFYIVAGNGQIMYNSHISRTGLYYKQVAPKGKNVVVKHIDNINSDLIYLYEDSLSTRLSVYITIAVLFLTILAVIYISYVLSRKITRPIVMLSRSMNSIKQRNYNNKVEIVSNDEIGELGMIYNEMTDTIKWYLEYEVKSKLDFKDAQIGALQAQISPHFLHNTLQAISNMASENNTSDINTICKSLSDMYRFNMNINENYTGLQNEIMNVRNYMLIISKRYNNAINFKIKIPPAFHSLQVPKLILQPTVENAVMHGLLSSPKTGKRLEITFECDGENKLLYIYVNDNGRGITAEEVSHINSNLRNANFEEKYKSYDSIGIYNVQKRINLLCGKQYGLQIDSQLDIGTVITYTLPLIRRNQNENTDC